MKPRMLAAAVVLCALVGCGGRGDTDAHKIAEFVISNRGSVSIEGLETPVKVVGKLPKKDFWIRKIDLRQSETDRRIVDIDLEQFKVLRRLEVLLLDNTLVTDSGLATVASLHTLRELSLYRTDIGDLGVEHLKTLPKLAKLELSYTAVDDAGLDQLASMKELKSVSLYGTLATDAGFAKLHQALPKLKINH
ncbi:MAG TPA: hypothetical protein VHB77_22060 [Planctomycetaceae bacterium]|nr:hypothetical protein [Planctomycetaceae bacterium]